MEAVFYNAVINIADSGIFVKRQGKNFYKYFNINV